ncbi:unnamed protein product [Withania somnifera]
MAEMDTVTQQNFAVKRKRNLPGNPDPEAEVVALSPITLMATNRFVCEICSKGFQRDQNLQLHRRGHNLPWKLRQRTSNEVKKRVYVCPESTCVHHDPSRALGDLTDLPTENQNQGGVQLPQEQGTTPVSTISATTTAGGSSSCSKVFASVFQSSSAEQGHLAYSDILRAVETEQMTTVEPMTLSLSSSLYLSNNGPTLFQEHTGHGQHYGSALSATALLQKAAQMGSTTSSRSFLRGLGLAMSSSTSVPDENPLAMRTHALSQVKLENNIADVPPVLGIQHPSNYGPSGLTDLMMGPSITHQSMMFGSKPPTLDFLGLGNGASGTPSNGFSAFLSSMEGGFGVVAEPWDDPSDRKPSML